MLLQDVTPYYTQELAFAVWNNLACSKKEDIILLAVKDIVATHDLDYERLWLNFNKTDKYVMVSISEGNNPVQDRNLPTSPLTCAVMRLAKKGYIIRSEQDMSKTRHPMAHTLCHKMPRLF